MIELTKENLITLSQAAAALPAGRKGRKTHMSTVLRWRPARFAWTRFDSAGDG
jgi:hypothetical protein